MPNGMSDHSLQDIYGRLGTVEQDVAAIGPVLKAVSSDILEIKRAKNQPINWVGFGSLVIAVLLYMQTTQDPIKEKAEWAMNELNTRAPMVYGLPSTVNNNTNWNTKQGAAIDALEKLTSKNLEAIGHLKHQDDRTHASITAEISRNSDIEERLSRAEGLLARLTSQVDQIDSGGSRKWNGDEK